MNEIRGLTKQTSMNVSLKSGRMELSFNFIERKTIM